MANRKVSTVDCLNISRPGRFRAINILRDLHTSPDHIHIHIHRLLLNQGTVIHIGS